MATKKTSTTKKATAKKAAPKKKTLKSLDQTHGKDETAASEPRDDLQATIKKAEELDEILGMRKISPFKTASLQVFEENLVGMNLTDMREIAVSAGIFPSGNKTQLKKKLIKGFLSFNKGAGSAASAMPVNQRASVPNSKLQSKISDIWAGK